MRNLTQIMHEKLRAVYFDTMAFKLKKKNVFDKMFSFFFLLLNFPHQLSQSRFSLQILIRLRSYIKYSEQFFTTVSKHLEVGFKTQLLPATLEYEAVVIATSLCHQSPCSSMV